ncbi:MAG: ankyrin repeat domain-containing protein [Clostridia bacterium]|nr:ankyrin repeat domain-containing protein [Clostridia bacterium]
MKKLFTAIKKQDMDTVKAILEKSPDLISCVSTGAPKRDIGQSPLQIALKESSDEVIHYLLDMGADVSFIESEDCGSSWRTPAIHDAINRAIMCSRWNVARFYGLETFSTKTAADEAFEILEKMIRLGADVNAKDSFENACLDRACLQASQILPVVGSNDRVLTEELKSDISRIFKLLIGNGADLNYVKPNGTGKTYWEDYENLRMFLE